MSDILDYPRDEDVTQIEANDLKISLVRTTAENRLHLVKVALSMCLGEHCKYCDREFVTLEDLKDSVLAGYHARGRIACKGCWERNNPPEVSDE